MRIAVIGAGRHCRREHLPALEACRKVFPEALDLMAICDPVDVDARALGFSCHCRSLKELLRMRPDAIIAVTPPCSTAETALEILDGGIPLLMEKPMGRNLGEVREVVGRSRGRPAMVSMNRRFDPAIVFLADWLESRPVHHLRATMARHGRSHEGFLYDAGLHALDTMGFLGRKNGHAGSTAVELFPSSGRWLERYEAFGPGFHAVADATGDCRIWQDGRTAAQYLRPRNLAPCERTGTLGETLAFLESVAGRRPWSPAPEDVLAGHEVALSGRPFEGNAVAIFSGGS